MWINFMASEALWPQTLKIMPGQSADYTVPDDRFVYATRFWPKYNC